MNKGRAAPTSIGGKAVGPVGFGMMGKQPMSMDLLLSFHPVEVLDEHSRIQGDVDIAVNLGLTIPWAPVEYPVAVKVLKTALEQGANFWNGVSTEIKKMKSCS